MRYYSKDRNCCVDTGQSNERDQKGSTVRADITIKHPCLVRIRLEPRRNEFIIRSRLSNKDVCSFARDELDQDDSRGIDLALLHGLPVKLLQDLQEDCASAAKTAENPFRISLSELEITTQTSQDLHPEVDKMLQDVLIRRKRQDEVKLAEYVSKMRADYSHFESQVTTQAESLSGLVIQSYQADERKQHIRRSKDVDATKECSRDRRLSNNSSQSASSTTSQDRARKRSNKSSSEALVSNTVNPLPKPALMTPLRKASLESSKRDGLIPMTPLKRVMFSEQEPTQISSTVDGQLFETEDEAAAVKPKMTLEADELFKMDEQITSMPIVQNQANLLEVGEHSAQQKALSDSFGFENIEKYDPPVSSSQHSPSSPEAPAKSNAFATSLPRTIARAPPVHAAPLSSVKDIPAFSASLQGSQADMLEGDTPPKGLSRKNMWQQAVASSLRMSGLILPTISSDELDGHFSTDLSSPRKVSA